jgi:hypothetical protein
MKIKESISNTYFEIDSFCFVSTGYIVYEWAR